MNPSPPTRTEEIYGVLRSELLNGVLCPGQKLRMIALGERFGVSQSVIREALTRLTEQGLVIATPQRGFRVRDLSIRDIAHLTESRVQIESAALRLAIERGDLGWEKDVVAAHHMLDRTPHVKDDQAVNEEWAVRHREFHQALLSGCDNDRLEAIAESLRDNAELYRRWYWVLADDHHRDITSEHHRLKDLALARDSDAAIAVLSEHIERAPRLLVECARERGVDSLHPPQSSTE